MSLFIQLQKQFYSSFYFTYLAQLLTTSDQKFALVLLLSKYSTACFEVEFKRYLT